MIHKLLLVTLMKVDVMFNIDQRLADRGIDSWAIFLEHAGMRLWPEYDGEGYRETLFGVDR